MATTEPCGSTTPHGGHNYTDSDGKEHWCPGWQGGGRD